MCGQNGQQITTEFRATNKQIGLQTLWEVPHQHDDDEIIATTNHKKLKKARHFVAGGCGGAPDEPRNNNVKMKLLASGRLLVASMHLSSLSHQPASHQRQPESRAAGSTTIKKAVGLCSSTAQSYIHYNIHILPGILYYCCLVLSDCISLGKW